MAPVGANRPIGLAFSSTHATPVDACAATWVKMTKRVLVILKGGKTRGVKPALDAVKKLNAESRATFDSNRVRFIQSMKLGSEMKVNEDWRGRGGFELGLVKGYGVFSTYDTLTTDLLSWLR